LDNNVLVTKMFELIGVNNNGGKD